MAEIKLIALDLDGTLLDSQKRLSYKNKAILQKCIQKGIVVVPCTGRIWFAVPDFLRALPGLRYAITTNGAVVEDVMLSKVLDERKLSCTQALELIELAQNFHTMYDAYAGGAAFGEARFIGHMEEFGIPEQIQQMIQKTRKMVPSVADELRRIDTKVEKVNYFFGDLEERTRAREALLARTDVVVSSSFPYNLEINALGATKGEAIMRLADHLGISPEQTMGFGDGENDLSMIRMTGIGVAMGNGLGELKDTADYVTATNDEDGVALAIEKLVFKEEID